jgi:hypothetical protein
MEKLKTQQNPSNAIERAVLTEHSFWDGEWREYGKPRKLDRRSYLDQRIAQFFDTHLPRSPLLAVELGAGNSIWLPYMGANYGYDLVGLDYSRMGCYLLRANLELVGVQNALIVEGDILQNCLGPGTVNVVFSNGLIEHFTHYPEILALFKSWLKPCGWLITFVPNKKHLFRHVEKWLARSVYDAHVLMEPKDLEDAYKQIGLEEIAVGYLGSFSTWKYTRFAQGATRVFLRGLATALNNPIHAVLKGTGWKPESKMFSPMVFAIGRVPGNPNSQEKKPSGTERGYSGRSVGIW